MNFFISINKLRQKNPKLFFVVYSGFRKVTLMFEKMTYIKPYDTYFLTR